MLDFRIATFLTVCRTLNYTRAAEELSITQPAVSQHISYLEKHYGVKLFALRGKKPELTRAGSVLRQAFSTMAHDELLLRERAQAAMGMQTVTLNVGATLTAGEYIVAQPLARWLARQDGVRLTVHSGDTRELLDLLTDGRIDCAFIEGMFDRNAYTCDKICTEELVCVCSPHHPCAGMPQRIDALLDEHLAIREAGSGTRAVFESALAQRNLAIESFARISEASNIGVIKALVQEGECISFMYRAAAQRELDDGTLARIPLDGAPITHDIEFVRLANSVFEDELARLCQQVACEMRAPHGEGPRGEG